MNHKSISRGEGSAQKYLIAACHDKQGIWSAFALSICQCFGVAVAFRPVKNDLTTCRAEVGSNCFDGDIFDGDITGISREGVGATAKALHRIRSSEGLKRTVKPF